MGRYTPIVVGLCLVATAFLMRPNEGDSSARHKRSQPSTSSGGGGGGSGGTGRERRYSTELNSFLNNPSRDALMHTIGDAEEVKAKRHYNGVRDANRASADEQTRKKGAEVKISYILLDPLPKKKRSQVTFQEMVQAIFYVGEGDMTRPGDHAGDALRSDQEIRDLEISLHTPERIRTIWIRPDRENNFVLGIIILTGVTKYESEDREGQLVDALGGLQIESRMGQFMTTVKHPTGQLRNIRETKKYTMNAAVLTQSEFNTLGVRQLVQAYRILTGTAPPRRMVWLGGGWDGT